VATSKRRRATKSLTCIWVSRVNVWVVEGSPSLFGTNLVKGACVRLRETKSKIVFLVIFEDESCATGASTSSIGRGLNLLSIR